MWVRIAMLWVVFGIAGSLGTAQALTLPVTGGPGLDGGAVCASGNTCPGMPIVPLAGPAAVTGAITYDASAGTVDVTLTLLEDALFSDLEFLSLAFVAGTTFLATDVPVTASPIGGGGISIVQAGAATGSVSPFYLSTPTGSMITATTPTVSGLSCTIFAEFGQCSVAFGPGGLSYTLLGDPVDTYVEFHVTVPEPGAFALLGLGIVGLGLGGRGRRRIAAGAVPRGMRRES